MHFRNSLNTKWLQIPQEFVYEKFYVYEIAAVDLSKTCFLKNKMKTCKPSNRDLNRDWKRFMAHFQCVNKFHVSYSALFLYLLLSLTCFCICTKDAHIC